MPQIVQPPDPSDEKEHPGFQIVRWLRPGGAALVLLLGILFVVQCFMTGREPVKGYQPKHDTAYYTAHLDALAEELNEDLLPQVDEHARAEAGDTVVTVYLPKETYITTRAAVLRYYDTSLFEFQES
jgi:hypothetical protein